MSPPTETADPPRDRLGRPIRDLRISVTDRCNFRCPYCMPQERFGERYRFVPRPELLRFEEIERLARLFVAQGVGKLRITGGEPLVRAELPKLVAGLASIEGVRDLALTTNGSLLAEHAGALREAGLHRVTVSFDSHDEEVYRAMNGRGYSTTRVLSGIEASERAGLVPIKINCVVQRGINDHTVVDLARYFKGTGHVVRFIEFMDVGTRNRWELGKVVSAREIVEMIDAELPLEPVEPNYPGEVASRYRYRDGDGEIGVISSVSQPFCRSCTRVRLSAEGRLVTCLFAESGVDLRGPLREGVSDRRLTELIVAAWKGRVDRYSEERSAETSFPGTARGRPRLEMHQIGG